MTQEQFDSRSERAEKDLLVISTTDEGWRVRSAHNPSRYYLVSGDGETLRCSCPDFEKHGAEDPSWTCKHILAIQYYQRKPGAARSMEVYSSEERAAIQTEGSSQVKSGQVQPENTNSIPSQMVLKRSLSPDGRIDSISILNVDVNGRRARFFGTLGQIVRAIAAAGEKLSTQEVEPGLRVDLPCRVIAQQSSDGRYLNVVQVLPADYRRKGNGAA